jgi:lactate dehydrogenase-like 2-hydroxyacid dehydrogenase
MIASISAGFSNVDLEECWARGVAVTNVRGLSSGDVADLAATMLTSLLLGIPKSQTYILEDCWTSPAGP